MTPRRLRPVAGRRPRGAPAAAGRGRAPVDHAAAHRLGELHLAGRAGRLRFDPHQQVRRGLPRPPLLRREPGHRRGRGPGPAPAQRAVRGRARQCAAPCRGQRQPGRLPGAPRTGRHHPGHAARPRRPPDPRLAGQHHLQGVALRLLRGVGGLRRPGQARRDHRLRPGGRRGPARTAQAHRGRLHRLLPDHRPAAVPGDRRLGGRPLHVRRRPPGRAHRRRGPPLAGGRGRRGHLHHPQDAARAAGGSHHLHGRAGQGGGQRRLPRPAGRPPRARHRGQGGGLRRGRPTRVPRPTPPRWWPTPPPSAPRWPRRASGWCPGARRTTRCWWTCAPSTPS